MIYNSISDNSSVTLLKMKKYLRLDESDTYQDDELKLTLAAAKEEADDYCQDSFADPATGEVNIPAKVDLWVMQTVSLNWERRGALLTDSMTKDLGQVKWTYDYDDYYHGLKSKRREVGFGPF